MQTRHMTYDNWNKTVSIDASESEFHPQFLKYLLEYHNIPKDVKIVFERDKNKKS